MKIQLYSVDHAPRALPTWQLMLDDLGHPPAKRVGRVLGISERSVYRWSADGCAPRLPSLALFWLTRWGRSAVDAQATNDARVAVGFCHSLNEQNIWFRSELLRVRQLAGLSLDDPFMPAPLEADGRVLVSRGRQVVQTPAAP
jgi:predicted DNA-binding transcriptional regulator AlpA